MVNHTLQQKIKGTNSCVDSGKLHLLIGWVFMAYQTIQFSMRIDFNYQSSSNSANPV